MPKRPRQDRCQDKSAMQIAGGPPIPPVCLERLGGIEFQEILPAWLSPDHRDKRTVVTDTVLCSSSKFRWASYQRRQMLRTLSLQQSRGGFAAAGRNGSSEE